MDSGHDPFDDTEEALKCLLPSPNLQIFRSKVRVCHAYSCVMFEGEMRTEVGEG